MPVETLPPVGLDPVLVAIGTADDAAVPLQAAGDVAMPMGASDDAAGPMRAAVDGATAVAVAVLLGQALAFVLACWIGHRTYSGYREAGGSRPALYWLAIGIVLLAAAPTALRFLLPTLFAAGTLTTSVLATSSEIAGLVAILYAVFGRP